MNYLVAAFTFLLSFHRHSYVGYGALILILSISPMIKYFLGFQSLSIFYALFIGVIILSSINRGNEKVSQSMVLFILVLLVMLLIQQLLIGFNFALLALGLVKLTMLPLLGYFVARELHSRNKDIFSVFAIYLMVNVVIFFWRAFYDYSFFGILNATTFYGGDIGSLAYRPSNLTSPIIFGIELAMIISTMYVSNFSKWTKIFLFGVIFLILIIIQSRAAIFVISLMLMLYLNYSKQGNWNFFIILTAVALISLGWFLSNELPYIFSLLSYEGGAYDTRISSVLVALEIFSNVSPVEFIFGVGSGLASQHASSFGYEAIYVENGLVSLMVENGFLVFIFFMGALVYYPMKKGLAGICGYLYILLLSIVFVNLFSASLTVISVQAIFWLVYFYGLFMPTKALKPTF